MNVVINEQIERKQRIVIYTPVLGGKSLVMDYVFHISKNPNPSSISIQKWGWVNVLPIFFQTIPICLDRCFFHITPSNTFI